MGMSTGGKWALGWDGGLLPPRRVGRGEVPGWNADGGRAGIGLGHAARCRHSGSGFRRAAWVAGRCQIGTSTGGGVDMGLGHAAGCRHGGWLPPRRVGSRDGRGAGWLVSRPGARLAPAASGSTEEGWIWVSVGGDAFLFEWGAGGSLVRIGTFSSVYRPPFS